MDELRLQYGHHVLDVGCGAGQTVLQLAGAVGPAGSVVGIDIAPLLVEIARKRTVGLTQVSLRVEDAQSAALPGGFFDAVFSRFGVMAFDDPKTAFHNFHRALKPEGQLAFVCWRSLAENDLDLIPLRAAGLEIKVDHRPFVLADPNRTRAILISAGFRDVAVRAHDEQVSSGSLDAMLSVLIKVGPLGKILRERPSLRHEAEKRVRSALTEYDKPDGVKLKAATWIVTARA
jgi:SAM-dependent methyltransferase